MDLVRDNFPIFECVGAWMARRLRRGLFDTNKEQATQPAGLDPRSETGSCLGPDPMARRTVLLLLMTLLVGLPAFAQNSNVTEARRLADGISQAQELPVNVRLRMQLMRDMMGGLTGKGDPGNALKFFSTTRILFWNNPVNPATGQQMRAFEGQVVALAAARGVNLDLPPVGYSPSGAPANNAPSSSPATPGDMLVNLSTREGLFTLTLRAEEEGTEALGSGGLPALQAVRDSLTVLRLDLNDAQVSSDAVRNVLLARARYMASTEAGHAPRFSQALDVAIEALRSNFPPDKLRSARGGQLPI